MIRSGQVDNGFDPTCWFNFKTLKFQLLINEFVLLTGQVRLNLAGLAPSLVNVSGWVGVISQHVNGTKNSLAGRDTRILKSVDKYLSNIKYLYP